jgi:hypothetical protein
MSYRVSEKHPNNAARRRAGAGVVLAIEGGPEGTALAGCCGAIYLSIH